MTSIVHVWVKGHENISFIGLYAENHGFGANCMWDRVKNRKFWSGETSLVGDNWWPHGVVPAWYSTGKSNVDVHCYWMPGCDVILFFIF